MPLISRLVEELWRDKLPATTMTTPITYEVGGRQYVVVVSGGHAEVPSVRGDYVSAYALPENKSAYRLFQIRGLLV